jgi:hypothetical protein
MISSKKLINKSKGTELANQLEIANNIYSRTIGLIGKKGFSEGNALWITRCKSIHTFFMSFHIDAIFVDKNLIVKKCVSSLSPWKITSPIWVADSVIELPQGVIVKTNTKVGDQLYVVN